MVKEVMEKVVLYVSLHLEQHGLMTKSAQELYRVELLLPKTSSH